MNKMVIDKYNILLRLVDENSIEKLRNWRNSDFVNNQMFYNEYITEDMQIEWYKKLDKTKNFYFIAEYQNKEVGVVHIKDIDLEKSEGEGGIFLIDSSYENSDIVPRMVLSFNDFVFYELKLKYIISKVKKTNKKAIASSKAQGCVEDILKEDSKTIFFRCDAINYEKKMFKIKKILS